MTTKFSILKSAIQIVLFLFAAFGSFFLNIAPPDETVSLFSIGLSSFSVLIILLIIKSGSKGDKRKWYKLLSSVFLVCGAVSGVYYSNFFLNNTYVVESDESGKVIQRDILGTTFVEGKKELLNNRFKGNIELMMQYHSSTDEVFTKKSINALKSRFTVIYLAVVLSFCSSTFFILETLLMPNF